MTTPAQLITHANNLVDDTFDNAKWIDWFNDALDDLNEVMFIQEKSTITQKNSDGSFVLPTNFKSAILVKTDNSVVLSPLDITDDYSIGYKIFKNSIIIQGTSADSIDLYYYKLPAYLTTSDITITIDMPTQYDAPLVLFACMRAMQSDDEDARYQTFKADYLNAKAVLLRNSSKLRPARVGSWQVIR